MHRDLAWHGAVQGQDLFGDLAWTDSPNQVHSKLSRLGYSGFGLKERFMCLIEDSCAASFSGPSVRHGFVRFSNGSLWSVYVDTASYATALDTLTRKYGQPIQVKDEPEQAGYKGRILSNRSGQRPLHLWTRPGGVTITIYNQGAVLYENANIPIPDSTGIKNL
jgi:hypothetical protein